MGNFLSLSPESLLEQGLVFSVLFHSDSSQLEAILTPKRTFGNT